MLVILIDLKMVYFFQPTPFPAMFYPLNALHDVIYSPQVSSSVYVYWIYKGDNSKRNVLIAF